MTNTRTAPKLAGTALIFNNIALLVEHEFYPASGDGWHEEVTPAYTEILSVEHEGVDVIDLLNEVATLIDPKRGQERLWEELERRLVAAVEGSY